MPSIFDSFNARSLTPTQVARTFVPSLQYQKLSLRRHSVLVGPRGSGKTTLLKMLHPQALENWPHPAADLYRNSIDFTGVFIPTDLTWREQINALGGGSLDKKTLHLLSAATVTTHVLRALVGCMMYRSAPPTDGHVVSFRRVDLSVAAETEVAGALAEAWELRVPVRSLLAIKHSLSLRLLRIRQIAQREAELDVADRAMRLATEGFLFLEFIQAATVGVERFDDATGEPDARWALMFDELELAPDWLQHELMSALRSREERFIFKLALSPFTGGFPVMENQLSAASDQDYDPISLWYAGKRSSHDFCTSLWYQMLKERNLPATEPATALGQSAFYTPSEEWRESGTAYSSESRLGKRLVTAAQRDSSFRQYLNDNGINTAELQRLDPNQRAAIVRKAAPVLVLREYFRTEDAEGRVKHRSRKRPLLYAGADSLFAISEGNPRWFIAIVGRLLDRCMGPVVRISESAQAEEMLHAAQRFSAMLGTIPNAANLGVAGRGLLGMIETIATYIHQRAVYDPFNPEPPSTVFVDSRVSSEIATSMGQALNAGAIVYVPDDFSQLIIHRVYDKRFRLSYLLAPLFGLPIRLGKEIALSSIIKMSAEGGPEQLTLT